MRDGRQLLGVLAAALAGIAVSLLAPTADAGGVEIVLDRGGPKGGGSATGIFEISGSVADLYPGAELTLEVKIENPHPFDLLVTTLQVLVHDASNACPAETLTAADAMEQTRVPARGETIVPLAITMLPTAPDACQGATFPLTYSGEATNAEPGDTPRLARP